MRKVIEYSHELSYKEGIGSIEDYKKILQEYLEQPGTVQNLKLHVSRNFGGVGYNKGNTREIEFKVTIDLGTPFTKEEIQEIITKRQDFTK